MKAEKLRGVDIGDLDQQLQESEEQLFRLRFQIGMGQLEGLKKYRALKKDRSRMLTVLNEKKRAGETASAKQPAAKKKKK